MATIAIIGLGYVGLPLARLLATKHTVIGLDVKKERIEELNNAIDSTGEVSTQELTNVLLQEKSITSGLFCTSDENDLSNCEYYIITVPTPINKNNTPDLCAVYSATKTVAKYLKKNAIVIYESTVYPGVTEDECVPILEQFSELKFQTDFEVGYSPERINPGDKLHTVDKILKVVSASSDSALERVDNLYKSVITAGTFRATSIKVAEAAKVIENTQRDINIAFINELFKLFNILGINTKEVLQAAATKWNFIPFQPGFVGGHCIGVDPYYLAHKAQQLGYYPEMILAGRRINDTMPQYIASEIIKEMIQKDIPVKSSKILILGIAFKENCADVRNTKIISLVNELKSYGALVDIHDPLVSAMQVKEEYNLSLLQNINSGVYNTVVLAVPHKVFLETNLKVFLKDDGVFYDMKGVYQ
ncbi:nucleotide sugar dehydrogenase [Zhouia sp. PK063]|uniref:nucleotide sugar dehydrogenase n=1 Tax=Zhouia sp. PK063 TaxID=3373602 RepID=UPI0037A9A0C2